MGFNLGILGQIGTRAVAGGLAGQAAADEEIWKRRMAEIEMRRRVREQAMQNQLLGAQTESERAQGRAYDALATQRTTPEAPDVMSELEQDEIRSRIGENNAQRDLYNTRRTQVGRGRAGGTGGKSVEPDWQKRLEAISHATEGDLAEMHRQINADPELFELRKNGTIKDYHVGAASSKARKTYRTGGTAATSRKVEGTGGGELSMVPARYRKFPSETKESWAARLRRQGVDEQEISEYASRMDLDDAISQDKAPRYKSDSLGTPGGFDVPFAQDTPAMGMRAAPPMHGMTLDASHATGAGAGGWGANQRALDARYGAKPPYTNGDVSEMQARMDSATPMPMDSAQPAPEPGLKDLLSHGLMDFLGQDTRHHNEENDPVGFRPGETPENWVRRMKTLGYSAEQVVQFARQLGLE